MKYTRVRLGSDRYGNTYWLDHLDRYIYQMTVGGVWCGWFCSLPAWESTLHRILVNKSK